MHLKSIRGSQSKMLDAHLDNYIYRYNRKNEGEIFNPLIMDIAEQYSLIVITKPSNRQDFCVFAELLIKF